MRTISNSDYALVQRLLLAFAQTPHHGDVRAMNDRRRARCLLSKWLRRDNNRITSITR